MTRPALDATWSADALLHDPSLSLFQKTLLLTDGTLTDLLVMYTGQAIVARRLEQSLVPAAGPLPVDCAPGDTVLHRRIVLSTAAGEPHVVARSCFAFERFSPQTRHGLLDTELPIGVLWREEKLEMYREVVERKRSINPEVARLLGVDERTPVLSRTYRIFHDKLVLGVITEQFAATNFC